MPTKVLDTNLLVKKHNDLIRAKYSLSLPAFRMLTYILSLIKVGDSKFKEFKIFLKESSEDLRISPQNEYHNIDDNIDELLGLVAKVPNPDGYEKFQWFSKAKYHRGKGYFTFKIHEDMEPLLLELKNFFTQYDIRNLEGIKSTQQIRLFELITSQKYKGEAYYSCDEIKDILELPDCYRPNHIKQRLIEPVKTRCDKNLHDINFEISERKKVGSKKVIGFSFKNIRVQGAIWASEMSLGESKYDAFYNGFVERGWTGSVNTFAKNSRSDEELQFILDQFDDQKKKKDLGGAWLHAALKSGSWVDNAFEAHKMREEKKKSKKKEAQKRQDRFAEEEKKRESKKKQEREQYAQMTFEERLNFILENFDNIRTEYEFLENNYAGELEKLQGNLKEIFQNCHSFSVAQSKIYLELRKIVSPSVN